MELLTVIAMCYTLSSPELINQRKEYNCEQTQHEYSQQLTSLEFKKKDIEAIKRITAAEAKNQGVTGIAGVIYVIFNRYISGKFGSTIGEIINSKNQFEPATEVNGWENLPEVSKSHKVTVDTIITLIKSGSLLDPTHGALYFQNPIIVSQREKKGEVSKGLTRFGNKEPTITIKDHEFYTQIKKKKAKIKEEELAHEWDIYTQGKTNKVFIF